MNRVFNIIERAETEFSYEYDMQDSLLDILGGAEDEIINNVDYDIIDECETNRHYNHISWADDYGFTFEAVGEFLSTDDRHNRYFRMDFGDMVEIKWYDHKEGDYVLMDRVINSEGKVVALVAK